MSKRLLAWGLVALAVMVAGCTTGPFCNKCGPTRSSYPCCPPNPCPPTGAVVPAAPPPAVSGYVPASYPR